MHMSRKSHSRTCLIDVAIHSWGKSVHAQPQCNHPPFIFPQMPMMVGDLRQRRAWVNHIGLDVTLFTFSCQVQQNRAKAITTAIALQSACCILTDRSQMATHCSRLPARICLGVDVKHVISVCTNVQAREVVSQHNGQACSWRYKHGQQALPGTKHGQQAFLGTETMINKHSLAPKAFQQAPLVVVAYPDSLVRQALQQACLLLPGGRSSSQEQQQAMLSQQLLEQLQARCPLLAA